MTQRISIRVFIFVGALGLATSILAQGTATPTVTGTPPTPFPTPTPTISALITPTLTPTVGPGAPTSTDQCKNGGWRTFTNPRFKNQGDCVSFVASRGRAGGNPKGTPTPLPKR